MWSWTLESQCLPAAVVGLPEQLPVTYGVAHDDVQAVGVAIASPEARKWAAFLFKLPNTPIHSSPLLLLSPLAVE